LPRRWASESPTEIVTSATGEFPIPPDALRLVLRNLLANAVAAGAERIHVSALARGEQRILVVDDDGVGLASANSYATGAQLGLRLCRRLVERWGGALRLRLEQEMESLLSAKPEPTPS